MVICKVCRTLYDESFGVCPNCGSVYDGSQTQNNGTSQGYFQNSNNSSPDSQMPYDPDATIRAPIPSFVKNIPNMQNMNNSAPTGAPSDNGNSVSEYDPDATVRLSPQQQTNAAFASQNGANTTTAQNTTGSEYDPDATVRLSPQQLTKAAADTQNNTNAAAQNTAKSEYDPDATVRLSPQQLTKAAADTQNNTNAAAQNTAKPEYGPDVTIMGPVKPQMNAASDAQNNGNDSSQNTTDPDATIFSPVLPQMNAAPDTQNTNNNTSASAPAYAESNNANNQPAANSLNTSYPNMPANGGTVQNDQQYPQGTAASYNSAPAGAAPKKKGKKGLIIGIICAAVVLLGAGAAAFFIFANPFGGEPGGGNESSVVSGTEKKDEGGSANKNENKTESKPESSTVPDEKSETESITESSDESVTESSSDIIDESSEESITESSAEIVDDSSDESIDESSAESSVDSLDDSEPESEVSLDDDFTTYVTSVEIEASVQKNGSPESVEIPQFNFDSDDADAANEEIRNIVLEEGRISYNPEFRVCGYGSVLSLYIKYNYVDYHYPTFKTYNFDMKTKKLISNSELMKAVGVSETDYEDNLEDFITQCFCEYHECDDMDGVYSKYGEIATDKFINDRYGYTIRENTKTGTDAEMCIDDDGVLYVCLSIGSFAGADAYFEMFGYDPSEF